MVKSNFKSINAIKKKKIFKKKDEENILSKDIDMEEDIKFLDRITERSGVEREMSNINYSKSFIKNLKFKPFKYKGAYLPYHLRWIFGNSIKNNEISLVQEIKALETEVLRLKQIKLLNKEFRKVSGMHKYNVASGKLCLCCNKVEPANHFCVHSCCEDNCVRKKVEIQFANTYSAKSANRYTKALYNNVNINNLASSSRQEQNLNTKKISNEDDNNDETFKDDNSINISALKTIKLNKVNAKKNKEKKIYFTTKVESYEKYLEDLLNCEDNNDNYEEGEYNNESKNSENKNLNNNNNNNNNSTDHLKKKNSRLGKKRGKYNKINTEKKVIFNVDINNNKNKFSLDNDVIQRNTKIFSITKIKKQK